MSRIKLVGTNKKLHAEFDSVNDVFRAINKLGWVPKNSKESNARKSGSFHTFDSLDEANDVFLNRPEEIRAFSQKDERITHIEAVGNDVLFNVTGDYLDIDKYLEGVPEVFGNAVMGNPKSVFATINVLHSAVYYTHADYMLEKAKRILRLVDWLENQGIRSQVVLTQDSNVCYTSIIVKQFQDPFDLNQLAVALHPDFFRRTQFLLYEQSATWESGYGSAAPYDNKMKNYKPNPEDGLYIYVGGYSPFNNTKSQDDHGKIKLNEAFDVIEANIAQMISDNMTYCEEPLIITGS